MLPTVSILIVNWNTKDLLRKCVASVYDSVRAVTVEVVVVDNGSTDGSAEMVKRIFPGVKLLENRSNLGFAAANNMGIGICSGEMVLLLNSDTQVLGSTIDACVEYMARHPKTGVLGCRVLNPDGTFQSSYFRSAGLWDLFMWQCLGFGALVTLVRMFGFRTFNFPSRYWGREFVDETEVDVVAGCFFMVRRAVIAQVGPLDEDFFFYGEEEEWCCRIRRAGWSVVYYPFAEIVHIHGASSEKLACADYATRRASLVVLDKTRGRLCAWLGNLIMSAGGILRIPFWIWARSRKATPSRTTGQRFSRRRELLYFHMAGLFKPVWRRTLLSRGEQKPSI